MVAIDLADAKQAQDFAQQIQSLSISVLCNAAGILIPGTTTADFTDTKRVIETNLMGTIRLTNLLSENMKRHNNGYIFSISSTQSITATHEIGIYGATKAALIKYSEALNKDLAPYQIKSTCIFPSITNTDMMRGIRVPDKYKIPTVDIAKTVSYCLSLQHSECARINCNQVKICIIRRT